MACPNKAGAIASKDNSLEILQNLVVPEADDPIAGTTRNGFACASTSSLNRRGLVAIEINDRAWVSGLIKITDARTDCGAGRLDPARRLQAGDCYMTAIASFRPWRSIVAL